MNNPSASRLIADLHALTPEGAFQVSLAQLAQGFARWRPRAMRRRTIALLILATCCASAVEPRPGTAQLSDGTTYSGMIALIPGGSLQLHDGVNLKTVDFTRVRELRLLPEKEHLEKNFHMVEAGKAFREEVGQPYPVRQLGAQLELVDGTIVKGHLATTAMTVDVAAADAPPDDPPQRHKLMLPTKQQGKPGEGFAVLVFPSRIRFTDQVEAAAAPTSLRLSRGDADELAVLSREGLAALAAKRSGPGVFTLEAALGAGVFLATRSKLQIAVGWPAARDAALDARMTEALKDAADFFDERLLLGVYQAPGSSDIFTVLRLYRRGEAVDGHPWHIDIWRWHSDDERVMLAGRGTFFRGLATSDADLPTVTLTPSLWELTDDHGVLVTSGQP